MQGIHRTLRELPYIHKRPELSKKYQGPNRTLQRVSKDKRRDKKNPQKAGKNGY